MVTSARNGGRAEQMERGGDEAGRRYGRRGMGARDARGGYADSLRPATASAGRTVVGVCASSYSVGDAARERGRLLTGVGDQDHGRSHGALARIQWGAGMRVGLPVSASRARACEDAPVTGRPQRRRDVFERILQCRTYSTGEGGGARGGDEHCGGDHGRRRRALGLQVVLPVALKRAAAWCGAWDASTAAQAPRGGAGVSNRRHWSPSAKDEPARRGRPLALGGSGSIK
ncbi:hypothetical protein DFH08DRAFT_905617 [Mycena albidolilacea]|uniref:Uncharacterized protein n=1 Tax=Mycena albidolilacea TaxID=1033008 RepID=A0AAD7E813_9AGAR|nr:hypothetical protein DFH08DRAFT_905617 [Mycena albidolilacea]